MHAASVDIRCRYFGFYMLEFIWGYFPLQEKMEVIKSQENGLLLALGAQCTTVFHNICI